MLIKKLKKITILLLIGIFFGNPVFAERYSYQTVEDLLSLQSEDLYLEFLRDIILMQPEFSYASAIMNEAEMNLKFSKRQRFPELSLRVVNDEVLSRKIKENNAIRKIRDDSFDGVIEIRQAI